MMVCTDVGMKQIQRDGSVSIGSTGQSVASDSWPEYTEIQVY